MAALQARARPIAPTYEEEELEVNSLSSLDSARLDSEGDWRIIDGGNSPSAQAISLPRHDGQGIFPAAEDDQQLLASTYASARADGSWHQSSATDSSSARFSFSTSSSSADQARRSVARKRSSYQGPTEPLTEHALASVSANYDVGDDEAVLTSSSASETSDVEDLLSRTPQAASAGLSTTPKRGRVDAGVKRRHRRSGVSSHGSKRSNTSSGQSRPLPLLLAPSLPSPRSVDTRDQFFLGRVVRKVMAVDEDTLNLVAGERCFPPSSRALHKLSHVQTCAIVASSTSYASLSTCASRLSFAARPACSSRAPPSGARRHERLRSHTSNGLWRRNRGRTLYPHPAPTRFESDTHHVQASSR